MKFQGFYSSFTYSYFSSIYLYFFHFYISFLFSISYVTLVFFFSFFYVFSSYEKVIKCLFVSLAITNLCFCLLQTTYAVHLIFFILFHLCPMIALCSIYNHISFFFFYISRCVHEFHERVGPSVCLFFTCS